MAGTIFSLIPPIVAILMVILTRRVLLSLGVGIFSAAFLLHGNLIQENGIFSWLKEVVITIWESLKAIFISDGA